MSRLSLVYFKILFNAVLEPVLPLRYTRAMSETTHPSSYISISWNVYTPQETCNRFYYQAGLDADGRDVTPMEAIQALADADFIRIEHNGLDGADEELTS